LEGREFANRRWYELSGGETQRVALAARLVLAPEVLLMDEPTASVDAVSAQLIKDAALQARQQWGTTLVIASHDWQWLYEICDEVRHLFRGQFFAAGEENFVFGPWVRRDDTVWEKQLPDGQTFFIPRPPTPEAAAVIPAAAICIQEAATDTFPSGGTLRGQISRLIHEKRTDRIVATILVGSLPFTVKVTRDEFHRFGLYPGRAITLGYDPNGIKWSNG
jgi:tungstate transport system ATP-binding protein